MANMAGAGIANGIAAGLKGYVSGMMQGEQLKRERERAQQQKALMDLRLQEAQYNLAAKPPIDDVQHQYELKMQLLEQQTQDALNQLAKKDTYEAFRAYNADGDVEHINRAIQGNRVLQNLYPDLARVDMVDPQGDLPLIKQAGLSPEDVNDPNFKHRYVKVTRKDGTKYLMDMHQLQAATGYLKHATQEELDLAIKKATLASKMRGKQYSPSAYGKFVQDYKKYHPDATQEEIDAAYGARERTSKQKDLDAAQQYTNELLQEFGGEDGFFNTDFSRRENLTKAYKYLTAIEKLEGVEFSEAEKKKLDDIRTLIALGDPASKLSPEQTGLLDSTLHQVKKYIYDNVDGVEASSAYAAFRNSVRNALFGSALTDSEIKSFNEAFGTLGNQTGPVLQQFKTALSQVEAKLDSIATMKNPYSAHIRLGADQAKLRKIADALQQRIDYIEQAKTGKAKTGDGYYAPQATRTSTSSKGASDVVKLADDWAHKKVPYKWGGNTDKGVDCSGLVCNVFSKKGVKLPRTAWGQAKSKIGKKVSYDQIQPGDVLYLKPWKGGRKYAPVTHAAIVTGFTKDGTPIITHASTTKHKVVKEPLSEGRRKRIYNIKRYVDEPSTSSTSKQGKRRPLGDIL